MKLFVTGIGTDVGKTLASAILVEALNADYWKPVQSGNIDAQDKESVRELVSNEITKFHSEAYSFKAPLSPHYAAIKENKEINLNQIIYPDTNQHLIVEGAGGILVPLNPHHYVIELAKQFDLEVVLVVRNYLGCINHALLSIDYLLKHQYVLKGLILNGSFDKEVRDSIVNYANIPVLFEIPDLKKVNSFEIKRLADSIKIQ